MRAVIPYKKEDAKSRLSRVMTKNEREEFVECMLNDVVNTLQDAQVTKIDILTTSGIQVPKNTNMVLTRPGLNEGLNGYLNTIDEPVMIIMADLPLVRPETIKSIMSHEEDVVIVPGKGGGTNILYIKDPIRFHVKYYGCSFSTHCRITEELEMTLHIFDSFLASTDIDEPQDLTELLLHGTGRARDYVSCNFTSLTGEGRVKISPLCPGLP